MKAKIQTLALIAATFFINSTALAKPQITPTEQDLTVIQREITKDLFNKKSCFKGSVRQFANEAEGGSSVNQISWSVLDRHHETPTYPCNFQNNQGQTVGYDEATKAICLTSQIRLYKINLSNSYSERRSSAQKPFEVEFVTDETAQYEVAPTGEILESTKQVISTDSLLVCTSI